MATQLKNARLARMREIAAVLGRHGLGALASAIGPRSAALR